MKKLWNKGEMESASASHHNRWKNASGAERESQVIKWGGRLN